MLRVLTDMLTYCRPHGSKTEREFIRTYIAPLPGALEDAFGNWHVQIGADRRVLYSCHMDTVHRSPGRQKITIGANGVISLNRRSRSSCLGADDTAGVYLLRERILAGRPGYYLFHYGEESGCIGSSAIAAERPDYLADTAIAIAFDRGGRTDIITHQCGSRTASDRFARSLASQLNRGGRLQFTASDRGMFTDTREYADLIPECTNVSIGYSGAHTPNETLDSSHVARLREAVLRIENDALEVHRDPTAERRALWDMRGRVLDWPDTWQEIDAEIDTSQIAYLDPVYQAVQDDLRAWLKRTRAVRKGVVN